GPGSRRSRAVAAVPGSTAHGVAAPRRASDRRRGPSERYRLARHRADDAGYAGRTLRGDRRDARNARRRSAVPPHLAAAAGAVAFGRFIVRHSRSAGGAALVSPGASVSRDGHGRPRPRLLRSASDRLRDFLAPDSPARSDDRGSPALI